MILTDSSGRPIPPVDVPPPGAPVESIIAYLRASAARNDRIAALANGAFARAFTVTERPIPRAARRPAAPRRIGRLAGVRVALAKLPKDGAK